MSKVDVLSEEEMPESVDFFNTKPTLIGLNNPSFVEFPTIHPITDGPINFRVKTGQTYVDFSKSYLVTKFRVLKKEGQQYIPIKKDDPVSFIQGFGATFIKNVKVLFNNRQIYHGNDMFACNAYMKRRLGIGGKSKLQDLQALGFFEDELSQTTGPGFDARRALFADGKTFEAASSLDIDIFDQKKLFLDNMTVDIEIIPNNSAFTLISSGTQEYKYEILDCKLYVKTFMPYTELNHSVQENLEKGSYAKYNYTRNIVLNYFIQPGRLDFDTVLYTAELPKRIFVGLVDAKAFHGHIGMSPFEFSPHGLESIQISADNNRIPANPYKLDWIKNSFIRPFKDLSDATDHGISIAKYEKHSTFYCFDLQTYHDSDISEVVRPGLTSIGLRFSTPVPSNGLQLVVFGEFESLIVFDSARNFTPQLTF